jgi:hypothetical protein
MSLRRGKDYNQKPIDDYAVTHPGDDMAGRLDQKQRMERLLKTAAQLDERCASSFDEARRK